jgi:hypothetical protein
MRNRGRGENGAYEGHPFPTPTDAPRRLLAPTPGRPGAGFLRCPAILATSAPCTGSYFAATRLADSRPNTKRAPYSVPRPSASYPHTKPGSFCFA